AADFEAALSSVVAAVGPDRERVAAVGVAGMAESGAPLAAGRPVAPVIAWYDGRGEETVAALESRFGPDLARRTGRRVRTVSSVAKLGWLLDHGLAPPKRWLGVPELALFLLTGVEATEHSLAARTGAYDVIERAWLPSVAAQLGLPVGIFPAVRPALRPAGRGAGDDRRARPPGGRGGPRDGRRRPAQLRRDGGDRLPAHPDGARRRGGPGPRPGRHDLARRAGVGRAGQRRPL